MIKAVVDTNLIISGSISDKGAPYKLLKAWENKKFILLTTMEIINEAKRVLHYPKIKATYRLTEEDILNTVNSLLNDAAIVKGLYQVKKVKNDPTDDKFLGCALEGGASHVVSGDSHLLSLKTYRRIRIVRVNTFLKILE